MVQREVLNRSLDAGRDMTQRTQERIEALVRDLARNAEEQAAMAQQVITEIVERSIASTEQLVDAVDRELRSQFGSVGFATKADIERLESRIDRLVGPGSSDPSANPRARSTSSGKKASATAGAKKAAASKASPGTTTAKRAAAAPGTRAAAPSPKKASKKASARKAAGGRAGDAPAG
jgi:hypothetical protein